MRFVGRADLLKVPYSPQDLKFALLRNKARQRSYYVCLLRRRLPTRVIKQKQMIKQTQITLLVEA